MTYNITEGAYDKAWDWTGYSGKPRVGGEILEVCCEDFSKMKFAA